VSLPIALRLLLILPGRADNDRGLYKTVDAVANALLRTVTVAPLFNKKDGIQQH